MNSIEELRGRCEELGRTITAMHPLVPKLPSEAGRNEIFKALFELTKQVEVVKKHLLRMEKGDDSKLL